MNKLNDKQEKAAFFGLYINQKVLLLSSQLGLVKQYAQLLTYSYFGTIDDPYYNAILELTPLDQITDEHAIEVVVLSGFVGVSEVRYDSTGYGGFWITFNSAKAPSRFLMTSDLRQPVIDYLRSQGYLLPFRGYTTQQLLDLGWVKLRTT